MSVQKYEDGLCENELPQCELYKHNQGTF